MQTVAITASKRRLRDSSIEAFYTASRMSDEKVSKQYTVSGLLHYTNLNKFRTVGQETFHNATCTTDKCWLGRTAYPQNLVSSSIKSSALVFSHKYKFTQRSHPFFFDKAFPTHPASRSWFPEPDVQHSLRRSPLGETGAPRRDNADRTCSARDPRDRGRWKGRG